MNFRASCLVAGALLFALRCNVSNPPSSDGGPPADAGNDGGSDGGDDAGTDGGVGDGGCIPVQPVLLDCLDGDSACPTTPIIGDPPPVSGFQGYADPAVREDPGGSRLWSAYSWLHTRTLPNPDGGAVLDVDVVESHLAHSDDHGGTWAFDSVLWPAYTVPDPRDGGFIGYWSSETPDLIATEDGGNVTWFGVHLRYFLRPVTGYNPDFSEWVIAVSQGPTPQSLGTTADGGYASEQLLGPSAAVDEGLRIDVVLNSLSSELSACAFYNNPGIYFSNGKLYIAAECMVANSLAASVIAVFSTVPAGDIQSWVWSFTGILADHSVAQELGAEQLGEVDFVKGVDGQLLVLLDPAIGVSGLLQHTGCGAFELDSIDPPVLRRGCDGNLIERAFVSASDEPTGPGACTYDPSMSTGLVIMRRPTATDHAFLLHTTGLRP